MGEVNLKINGRDYPILCDDGQEGRIAELASYIDSRLQSIASSGAATSENHLLVLTSLILTDEIFELRDNLKIADEMLGTDGNGQALVDEAAISETLHSLANRITMVSDRIKRI
ncbi:MAG: cell division protein ZapA [Alphaproteobacteria bacterium]|nr:cell division protein ZapA [Alphaproteobacteria bacterium]HCQ71480.1 cell division protein ZapA [Rhodospirillaceae bacterium]|tara:strand:- start:42864 stop:43205 length:342 start_codon:yes stop_codon:yes gene_type:complete